ncbi:MAG: hypothetical protein GF355_16425 [Candidatus Eisenbacteria bacterium]|nr:hypothetical protein [Candidatus Eisenbacteria bacterium]
MSRDKGQIEILLLICCLVGVIAFFCLSLAFGTILLEPPIGSEGRSTEELLAERDRKLEELERLEADQRELEAEKARRAEQRQAEQEARREQQELMAQIEELVRRRSELQDRIAGLKAELARDGEQSEPAARSAREAEIRELEARLRELDARIAELEDELQRIRRRLTTEAENAEDLQATLDDLERHRRELEDQVATLKTKLLWAGNSRVRSPLFMDCHAEFYVLYPENRRISKELLEKDDALRKLVSSHDMLILFVRPDGYETFSTAFGQARRLGKPLAYEPVDQRQSLDFLKESSHE